MNAIWYKSASKQYDESEESVKYQQRKMFLWIRPSTTLRGWSCICMTAHNKLSKTFCSFVTWELCHDVNCSSFYKFSHIILRYLFHNILFERLDPSLFFFGINTEISWYFAWYFSLTLLGLLKTCRFFIRNKDMFYDACQFACQIHIRNYGKVFHLPGPLRTKWDRACNCGKEIMHLLFLK